MQSDRSNQALEQTSFLYGANATFIEELYAKYIKNPGIGGPQLARVF